MAAQLRDFARKNPMHYEPVRACRRSGARSTRPSASASRGRIPITISSTVPRSRRTRTWLYLKLNYEHAKLLLHGLDQPGRTGNWVATECGALYTIGALFPEFRDAAAWRQTAIDRISQELDRVVPPDGFEAELTPTYHYVALTGYRQPLKWPS